MNFHRLSSQTIQYSALIQYISSTTSLSLQKERKQSSKLFNYSTILYMSNNIQQQKSIPRGTLNIQLISSPTINRYKSKTKMTLFGFIICITGIIFGYGLTQLSTINIDTLITEYHITFPKYYAQGVLIGLMPFGGIYGAAYFQHLLRLLKRKTSILFVSVWMVLSAILMEIKTQQTLLIGRFLGGMCVGLYVSIGPIYLREVVGKELRVRLMSIFSLCKVIGIVIAYSIEDIMNAAGFQYGFRVLLGFNGLFAILIACLIVLVPDSPVQMIYKGQVQQAKRIISEIYLPEYQDQILQEMKMDDQASRAQQKGYEKDDGYTQNRKRAWWMGLDMVIIRQFLGSSTLISFAGQILEPFDHNDKYTALILNCIQLFSNAFCLIFLVKRIGRRPNFLVGASSMTIFNFGIAISLLFQQQVTILLFMALFMLIYGGTFLPVSWSYVSEIVPPQQVVGLNVIGWIATWIVTTVPPIIKGIMPGNNTYPCFFFFGTCGIIGTTYAYFKMVESKGKTYEEIIKQF